MSADVMKDLLERIADISKLYQRFGAICTFEGQPMMHLSHLEEIAELAACAESALSAPPPDALAPTRRVVVPSYEESKGAVEDGSATALHAFIYDNEPADLELEKVFRETLQAVLDDAVGGVKP